MDWISEKLSGEMGPEDMPGFLSAFEGVGDWEEFANRLM
jgi:hypothetical protein